MQGSHLTDKTETGERRNKKDETKLIQPLSQNPSTKQQNLTFR